MLLLRGTAEDESLSAELHKVFAKQSTAKTFLVGPILDSDGAAKTDEVVASIKVTKNGTVGAADGDSTLTHDHTGHYKYYTDGGDVDTLGEVEFSLNSGTNAMAPVRFNVLPANAYDSLVSGSDYLDTSVVQVAGSAMAANVLAASNYIDSASRFVLVAQAATAADRGTALLAAYASAKALTPGGAALSENNRAKVIIPPGLYDLASSTLDLDTEFVDLEALVPEMGGDRLPTDYDYSNGTTSLDSFRPPRTLIYSATADTTPVIQSVANVWLKGFGIAQLSGDSTGDYDAFQVTADSNAGSVYEMMYFWHKAPVSDYSTYVRSPVGFAKHVNGIWKKCISNSFGWRIGYDGADAGQFSAWMEDCVAGSYSYIGDYPSGHKGTHKATNSVFIRCKAIGLHSDFATSSGAASFAGCAQYGNDIDSGCVFIDCEAGARSYGLGATNAALMIRCRGGDYCCGSTIDESYTGTFSGTDIDGEYGAGSLGGRVLYTYGGSLTGTLRRSKVIGSNAGWQLTGAKIFDAVLGVSTANRHGLTLLDSTSVVHNSSITVYEGGTGAPIYAASAQNVAATGNAYNNKAAYPTGLGANVTNVGTSDAASSAVGSVLGNVGGNVVGSVASVTGAVGSVTGAVGSVTGNVGGNVAGSVASVTAGVTLADDAITAAKFDETTAFPLTAVDANATAVFRTGADSDTGETLSDQLDFAATATNISDLQTHGDSTWATATGFATPTNVSDLQTHGDSTWATATGFSTHSAADVVTAMLVAANSFKADVSALATSADLATVDGIVDTLVARLTAARAGYLDNLSVGAVPTATQNADALLDRASAIDGKTLRQAIQYLAAVLSGKVSGAGTGTESFVGLDGTTTRVVSTVDEDGNRSAVEYDPA